MKTLILNQKAVEQKVRRIAFEIYEQNFEEQHLILAGVFDRGFWIAQMLQAELERISPLRVTLMRINLDKLAPHLTPVVLDLDHTALHGQVVIVVDDVLNTGRTLAYSLSPFIGVSVKKLQVAVVVDRGHRRFPISADFVGYTLSTTINEHVEVLLAGPECGVYLH